MMENNELQQMAAFIEFAQDQLKQLELQHQVIGQAIDDIAATMVTIENLDKEQPDSNGNLNTVLPIGDNAFIRTAIKKPAGYLISIGARYFIEASRESSIKILESQKERMLGTLGAIEERMKKISEQVEKVRPVIEQQVQAMKSSGAAPAQTPKKSTTDGL
ncbi:MAG: prefoldin subunit alpha [Candidatus Sigynarchaeota archaeon]